MRPMELRRFLPAVLLSVACAAPRTEPAPRTLSVSEEMCLDTANTRKPPPRDYYQTQVDTPVTALPSVFPRYPSALREAGITGSVLARFVVDTTGYVDICTFRAVRSTHPLFTESVRVALLGMRFSPAVKQGKRVRQVVQAPFAFELPRP